MINPGNNLPSADLQLHWKPFEKRIHNWMRIFPVMSPDSLEDTYFFFLKILCICLVPYYPRHQASGISQLGGPRAVLLNPYGIKGHCEDAGL